MPSLVFALDVSISMDKPYSDLTPRKIEAVLNSLSMAVTRSVENGWRTGLVAFAMWTIPLVPPQRDPRTLLNALRYLDRTYEGSAPGDAILEAIRMLRIFHGRKRIVLITDGDYNYGIPPQHAILAANLNGVELHVIHIGTLDYTRFREAYEKYRQSARWHIVTSRQALDAALMASIR